MPGDVTGPDRLDVGFVPAEVPGCPGGTGAVETSRLLVDRLSRHHDLTVYVASQHDAADADLPATDRVEYVLHDDLPKLPHPITTKRRALRREVEALSGHDLVHSYSSAFIPVLADVGAPTLSTLNSYLPVCPKGDMRYRGRRKCTGPSPGKCATCIAATGLKRHGGVESELRSAYSSLGKIRLVEDSLAARDGVTAYHALSPHLKTDFGALGFDTDRIRVVPHFYDERFGRPADDRGDGTPSADPAGPTDPFDLLYVGALRDYKGVHVLIRALGVLARRNPSVRLRVAGTGPLERRLHALARDVGVADRVDWLGYVDHDRLPSVYADADAFVYPGLLDEPFGRVLLESLAAGTPVVASDVGSTDYVVGDAGERFTAGDPAALADAVDRLRDRYAERRRAIPGHLERFAPETVVGSFVDLYRSVADSVPADRTV
jgi:glycosyltransferase involved in cell wall biosynthesis